MLLNSDSNRYELSAVKIRLKLLGMLPVIIPDGEVT